METLRVTARQARPTWYGVVFATIMQDRTITSELKALVAVVSTYPREGWKWNSAYIQSTMDWGDARYQRVIREAKARGFLTINRVNRNGGIETEYVWTIEPRDPVNDSTASNRPPALSVGFPVQQETRPYNDEVKSNEEVKAKPRTRSAIAKTATASF